MQSRVIAKGWGQETIWADTELYCGKLLHFNSGAKFSMHFHANKDETWYVLSGNFTLVVLDTHTAERKEIQLGKGSIWRNKPLYPHQLIAGDAGGVIIEVSTKDSVQDNYRIVPGDSQK